jgi:hypothetical protein
MPAKTATIQNPQVNPGWRHFLNLSFYAFLFLRWVKPYAFLTLRDGRWLTR